MKFNCTKCGACCRMLGLAIELHKNRDIRFLHPAERILLNFPYKLKEDGRTCEKYDPVIGCTIYETRPAICKIDKMQPLYKIYNGLSDKQYHEMCASACNQMMDLLDINQSFRIPAGRESIN